MTKTIMERFFEERFGKDHPHDSYYEEWIERFASGHPETYMDRESLLVYAKVLKERAEHIILEITLP